MPAHPRACLRRHEAVEQQRSARKPPARSRRSAGPFTLRWRRRAVATLAAARAAVALDWPRSKLGAAGCARGWHSRGGRRLRGREARSDEARSLGALSHSAAAELHSRCAMWPHSLLQRERGGGLGWRAASSALLDLPSRLQRHVLLEGHEGCVNTVAFAGAAGERLLSGSDDQQIIVWDWRRGTFRKCGCTRVRDSRPTSGVFCSRARASPRTRRPPGAGVGQRPHQQRVPGAHGGRGRQHDRVVRRRWPGAAAPAQHGGQSAQQAHWQACGTRAQAGAGPDRTRGAVLVRRGRGGAALRPAHAQRGRHQAAGRAQRRAGPRACPGAGKRHCGAAGCWLLCSHAARAPVSPLANLPPSASPGGGPELSALRPHAAAPVRCGWRRGVGVPVRRAAHRSLSRRARSRHCANCLCGTGEYWQGLLDASGSQSSPLHPHRWTSSARRRCAASSGGAWART